MKKIKTLLAVVLALSTLVGCKDTTKPESNNESTKAFYQDSIDAYVDQIDMKYAYDLTYKLAMDESMHDNALGFRTAGSDAEHKAADFIAQEMESIGLVDIEKIPVTVDKWQFNGASLKIAGTDIAYEPVSYMQSGTDQDGITAQIVDCGTGFAEDYEGKDVEGKIVLIGVDQWNESWIDGYIYEASLHGVAALVTYDLDGYGRNSDDDHQIQDVCCEDVMPTVILTANEGKALAEEIAKGNNQCTLVVDSVIEINGGTSYDVVGKIKGKSSEQQMIFSGHYDMYFTGFQDDCSAIATAMSMAKTMIDSNYTPENDILVVAHGAEEWGISGTEFDWTRGAWELINNVHPEWAEKTIAMFNYELCAFDDGGDTFSVSCVPEYSTLVADLIEEGALTSAVSEYPGGISDATVDTTTMEDGVSYRNAGVPYFINVTDTCAGNRSVDEYGWTQLNYHTESDNYTTYCERTMKANIAVFGAIAIAIDQSPAMRLDLTTTTADLKEAFDEDYAKEANIDIEAWNKAVTTLEEKFEKLNDQGTDINERYAKAVAENASEEDLAKIRDEGKEYNQLMLKTFKYIQDNFVGIIFSSDIVVKHMGYQENLTIIDGVIDALKQGIISNEEGTGALDLAYNINGIVEYNYYIFSAEAVKNIEYHTNAVDGDDFKMWGENKGYELAQTANGTLGILAKAEDEDADFTEEIAIYVAAREEQLNCLTASMNAELDAMIQLAADL